MFLWLLELFLLYRKKNYVFEIIEDLYEYGKEISDFNFYVIIF